MSVESILREVYLVRWNHRVVACFVALSLLGACKTEQVEEVPQTVESNLSIEEQIAEATSRINANRLDAAAFHTRAQLHLINRGLAAAEDDINVAIKIDPKVGDYHYTLSDIRFAKGEIVLASEALSDGLDVDPENVTAMLALAELYYAMRDMKKSVILIKRVLKVEKHNAQAYLIHGMIFVELGDTARALSSLQTAVENDPNMEEAYLELGMIHYANLNPLTADYLNNVITLNPTSILAMYTKGMYFQKTGEVDLAIDAYNQILGVNANHAEANYNLGHLNFEHKQDYPVAILFFDSTIKSDSTHYKAHYMRGLSLETLSRFKEARDAYEQSLTIQTNYELAIQGLNRLDRLGE